MIGKRQQQLVYFQEGGHGGGGRGGNTRLSSEGRDNRAAANMLMTRMRQAVGGGGGRRREKKWEEERREEEKMLQHQESIKRREVTYDEDVWARQASTDFAALKLRHMQESEGTTQVSGDDYGELPVVESEEEPVVATEEKEEEENVGVDDDGGGEEVEEEEEQEEVRGDNDDKRGVYAYAYDERYLRRGGETGTERRAKNKQLAVEAEAEGAYLRSGETHGRGGRTLYDPYASIRQRRDQANKTLIYPVEGEEEEEVVEQPEGEEEVEQEEEEEEEYENEGGEEETAATAEYVDEGEGGGGGEEETAGGNVLRRVVATEEGDEVAADDDAWQVEQEEEEIEEKEGEIGEGDIAAVEDEVEEGEERDLGEEAEDREQETEGVDGPEGVDEPEEEDGEYYVEEAEQPIEESYEEEEEHVAEPEEETEGKEVVETEGLEKEEEEDLTPYHLSQIESLVEVRQIPEKGRCLYTRNALEPGSIIFVESPVFVATPSADPDLWQILEQLNEEEAFELPPVWHMGAICSLTQLSEEKRRICLDKWVPEPNKAAGYDVHRVIKRTGLPLRAQLYERMLMVWRYNSFGHHSEQPGLVLYNRISMMAHSCSASACWHYGEGDAFILRARIKLNAGDELTISYIGDEDLFKSSDVRREKLNGWLFTCYCPRCSLPVDKARGFRCSACATGTMFFKTDDGVTTSSACTVCQSVPSEDIINYYLEFEQAYVERLSETDKNDLADAKLVYFQAQRVFTQHWVLYQLHTVLFEGHRDGGDYETAAFHQMERIKYVSQVMPLASYTLAWLHEELGDTFMTKEEQEKKSENSDNKLNIMSRCFEDAFNLLYILCGKDHDYTIAADTKKSLCDKRLAALSAAAQS